MTNKCNNCNNSSCPDYISQEDRQKKLQKKVQFFIIAIITLLILILT